ncbi:hypothetical protein PQR37_10590 [Paraburkholderia nemoris]|uniref:hypothetical protein n=1 Tax=Paraburkholderia nemoris TaxID=2793076 RepID=UPI0038BBEB60
MNKMTERAKAHPVYLPNGLTVSLFAWQWWQANIGDLSAAIDAQKPDAYALSGATRDLLAALRENCSDAAILVLWDALKDDIKVQSPKLWSVANAAVGLLCDAWRRQQITEADLSPEAKALVDAYREAHK